MSVNTNRKIIVGGQEILAVFSSSLLLVLILTNLDSSDLSQFYSSSLAAIALATIGSTLFRIVKSYKKINHEMERTNKHMIFHSNVNNLADAESSNGAKILWKATKTRLVGPSDMRRRNIHELPELAELQNHVNALSTELEIHGSHILLWGIMQRAETKIAKSFLNISVAFIRYGRVKHSYLPSTMTADKYYMQEWFEIFDELKTVRMKTRFSIARVVDSLSIVWTSTITQHFLRLKR